MFQIIAMEDIMVKLSQRFLFFKENGQAALVNRQKHSYTH